MVLFDVFFRRHGVRQAMQLQKPPMSPMMQFTLPQLSVLHYVSDSALDLYPQANDWVFHDYHNPILVQSVTELASLQGMVRKTALQPQTLVKSLYNKVKRFRQLRDWTPFEKANSTLLVMNYGLLNTLYTYQRNVYSSYYRWYNIQATVWQKLGEMTQSSRREHFLFVKLPATLPSQTQLNQASVSMTTSLLKVFDTPSLYFLVEIWKWLGEQREQSLLNHVKEDKLKLVNLVFQEAGRFTVLNLGELNAWREHVTNETTGAKVGIAPVQLQRRFLHFCMSLTEAASVASDAPEADQPGLQAPSETSQLPIDEQNAQAAHSAPAVSASAVTGLSDRSKLKDHAASVLDDGHDAVIHPDEPISDRLELTDAELAKLEADLMELERVAIRVEKLKSEATHSIQALEDDEAAAPKPEVHPGDEAVVEPIEQAPTQYNPHQSIKRAMSAEDAIEAILPTAMSPEDGVKALVEKLSAQGLMSAAEQRRYLQQATRYKEIPAPLGNPGTLDLYRTIDHEILTMQASPKIPDIATVPDKSMLQSSLMSFDRVYTEKVLQKDVAGMVLNLQKAGLCVTDYEVEQDDTLMGSTFNYTVRINPVEGAPSTLRFKLPVVEEDGTYAANGVQYRLRKQRGDQKSLTCEIVEFIGSYGSPGRSNTPIVKPT